MGQGTVPDRLGDAHQTVGVAGRLAVLVLGNDHTVPIQNIPCQRGCQIFAGLRRKNPRDRVLSGGFLLYAVFFPLSRGFQ